jgi:hypothetical protein
MRRSNMGLLLAAGLGLATVTTIAAAAPGNSNPDAGQTDQGQTDQGRADQGQTRMPTTSSPMSDATVAKAGAALKDIAKVQRDYSGKLSSAESNEQKHSLTEQANAEAVQAIQSHGLSLQEYSSVVQTARSDPQLKQRLLDAASSTQ